MIEKKEKITILGVGNILLRDEGFGVHFVKWMAERYQMPEGVRLVDGGTLGYTLLDIICDCSQLIVVDVLKITDAPGSIYRFTKEEMGLHMPPPTSAHEVSFPDVLFKAELLDECPEVVFLCIVPQDFGEMGMEMTPVMREKFSLMEDLLLKELSMLGAYPEKKDNA